MSGNGSIPAWAQALAKDGIRVGGAIVLLYVLGESWVESQTTLTNSLAQQVEIAIQQASDHGLSIDGMRRQIQQIEGRVARLEAANDLGPRFTADQGQALESRITRLEGLLLRSHDHDGANYLVEGGRPR